MVATKALVVWEITSRSTAILHLLVEVMLGLVVVLLFRVTACISHKRRGAERKRVFCSLGCTREESVGSLGLQHVLLTSLQQTS